MSFFKSSGVWQSQYFSYGVVDFMYGSSDDVSTHSRARGLQVSAIRRRLTIFAEIVGLAGILHSVNIKLLGFVYLHWDIMQCRM